MDLTILGCFVAIAFIMYVSFQGFSPILMAPIAGAIVAVFAGMNVDTAVMSFFATGFGNMVKSVAFYFICSNIFGQVMIRTKMAYSIAYWISDTIGYEHAPIAIACCSALMAFGGMGFANYIVVYPIALVLCSKGNYSKGIIMGCVCGGGWTFAMTSPFSPMNNNSICMNLLGTQPSAGMIPGIAGGLVQALLIFIYLDWQAHKWRKEGKGFTAWNELPKEEMDRSTLPNPFVSLIPIIVVVFLFNAPFLNLAIGSCTTIGALVGTLMFIKKFSLKEWVKIWNDGAKDGVAPMANLAIMAGLGGIISNTALYTTLTEAAVNITMHPYIVTAITGNIVAFAVGSASSALGTSLPALQPIFETWCQTRGCDMGNFHRIMCVATSGLDTLPHNGTIASMNALYNTTHKESYFPVFITCTVIPLIAVFLVVCPLAMMGLK